MKSKLQIYVGYLLIFLFFSTGIIYAQNSNKENKSSYCQIAILALGPKPPRRYSDDNDTSMLLLPKPSEIPPRKLYIKNAINVIVTNKKDQKLNEINVSFNNPPSFITVLAGKRQKVLRKVGEDYLDYIDMEPLEAGSVNLILLSPSGLSGNRWISEPKIKIVQLSGLAFKGKEFAFINLSRRVIKSKFHETEKLIQPGKRVIYSKLNGLRLHRVIAQYSRENKIVINTAVKLNQSDVVTLYIFYDTNPNTNDRRTVGLMRVSANILELQKAIYKRIE